MIDFTRKLITIILIISFLTACSSETVDVKDISREDAILIAEQVWKKKYTIKLGYYNMDNYKPYKAYSMDDYWRVVGTRPENILGGIPIIEIRKNDKLIIKVYHTK